MSPVPAVQAEAIKLPGVSLTPQAWYSIFADNDPASQQATAVAHVNLAPADQPLYTTNAVFWTTVPSDPRIEGTTIPIYRVGALLDGGMSIEEVLEDFPSLNRAQVEAARDYARWNPNPWNPYPTKSFKRMLRSSRFYDAVKRTRKKKSA